MDFQLHCQLTPEEVVRLTALFSAPAEQGLDRLTRLAARILGAPVTMVNLIAGGGEICKSVFDRSGRYQAGHTSPLESSICYSVVRNRTPLVLADAREHPGFRSIPAVQAGRVVAYLGVPLVTSDGLALGSFCALDEVPRSWTDEQVEILSDLAGSVVAEIELRADMALRHAAEVELERTSQRLRMVLDESALGIALVGLNGQPQEVNPAMERMLGYSSEELCARSFVDFTHPDDVHVDWGLFAELVQGQRTHYQIEKRYIRKDGEVLWGRLTATAARDAEGHLLALLGMVEDLTEHRQVEALRERVRILEGLLPICMFCKAIRNDREEWELLESYISHHSAASFTHGCCPDCVREHFSGYTG